MVLFLLLLVSVSGCVTSVSNVKECTFQFPADFLKYANTSCASTSYPFLFLLQERTGLAWFTTKCQKGYLQTQVNANQWTMTTWFHNQSLVINWNLTMVMDADTLLLEGNQDPWYRNPKWPVRISFLNYSDVDILHLNQDQQFMATLSANSRFILAFNDTSPKSNQASQMGTFAVVPWLFLIMVKITCFAWVTS